MEPVAKCERCGRLFVTLGKDRRDPFLCADREESYNWHITGTKPPPCNGLIVPFPRPTTPEPRHD